MRTKLKILQASRNRLITFGFAILFNTILAASVCGTFAWYAYATRTGFEKQYHGVTIGDTGSLQLGILSDVELDDYNDLELKEDKETLANENKIIYWCINTENKVSPDILNSILSANGSATASLHPVTTGSNDLMQANGFRLYKNPSFLHDYHLDDRSWAEKDEYVHIPFVFRFENSDGNSYVDGKEIFFTQCDAEIDSETPEKEIHKATRAFLDNGTTSYLINPNVNNDGSDVVGGILDLNGDGFYDYYENKEVIYGESESFDYEDNVTADDGTLSEDERTTFLSNHKSGVYALNEETFVPKRVNYYCMRQFENMSQPVTITSANDQYLARLDFYAFVEGWDTHVIDREIGSAFNMEINFRVKPNE